MNTNEDQKQFDSNLSPSLTSRDFFDSIEGAVPVVFVMSLFGPPLWQSYQWLKTGIWHPLYFHQAFTFLGFDLTSVTNIKWIGVQKAVIGILELPMVAGLSISAFIFAIIFFFIRYSD